MMQYSSSSIEQITEGNTQLFVPKVNNAKGKGPATRGKQVFYNPAMYLNRDISVLVAQWLVEKHSNPVLLDGLAATGVRGIRFANEINGAFHVVVNDVNPRAFDLLNKNIQHNDLSNAKATNENLNTLLSENKFDYVDVDPFGSPAGFVDSAVRSLCNKGILAVTATDTATLCGVYPRPCRRRYGAYPSHSWVMHEVAIRILLGFVAREAAKHDKGIIPLLCHSTDHYFRLYVRLVKGAKKANVSLKKLSFMQIRSDGVYKKTSTLDEETAGPLWVGELHDGEVIDCLRQYAQRKTLAKKNEVLGLLSILEEEAKAPLFYYTVDFLSSLFKISPPKRDILFNKLRENGFIVRRTHFAENGFKTDASIGDLKNIFVSIR